MKKKKINNPTDNPVKVVNAYEHYGLNNKSTAKDKTPDWMDKIITEKHEKVDVSKFKNIWP